MNRYLATVAVCIASAMAQLPRNACGDHSLIYQLPWPQRLPPLSIYMPYDVLVGYIGLDSANWASRNKLGDSRMSEFLERRGSFDDDTLRKMVRSMFAMCDYNPMLYEATLSTPRYRVGLYGLDPYMIGSEILSAIERAWGSDTANKYRDLALLRADYILHVKVEDTIHTKEKVIVTTCQVLDVLKGQVAPACDPTYTHWTGRGSVKNMAPAPSVLSTGTCLQFVYIPRYRIGGYVDVIYPPWDRYMGDSIYPGKEYMVMLVYAIRCYGDSVGDWHMLTPMMIDMKCENSQDWFQVSPAAYAIEQEGSEKIVRMPWNEFGWGTSVPLATFKQRLRSRIEEFRSW
ncbi:MAG: hypothetical protein KatS3mg039_1734 [Candidatus Kapaibacterium sp.]|nr:MAG: hypothetical protein KatS3mg039_1734 [Candidatus Kapabacteria bacterium]